MRFRAFGAVFESDLLLSPPLAAAETDVASDVQLLDARGQAAQSELRARPELARSLLSHGAIAHNNVFTTPPATFAVADGRLILCYPISECLHEVTLIALGQAVARALRQRTLLVLHASAFVGKQRAVAVVAQRGAGKSTLAGAAGVAAHPVLTDDLLPVLLGPSRDAVALPGLPFLKLWPRAMKHLGLGQATNYPPVHPNSTKRFVRLPNHLSEPVELGSVLILERGPLALSPLPETEATVKLATHVYGAEGLAWHEQRAAFRQCASLCRRVRVSRLSAPNDLPSLDELVALAVSSDAS